MSARTVPHPDLDPWRDEMLHSLLDGRAKYSADNLPDKGRKTYGRQVVISLGTCAGERHGKL